MSFSSTFFDLLGIVANIAQVLGVPGLITFATLWWRRGQLARRRERSLAQSLLASEKVIEELQEELAKARAQAATYNPALWLETTARERKDGNETKAADVLRRGDANTSLQLHDVYSELAHHYVSLYPDHGSTCLMEALRCARIACELGRHNTPTTGLLDEIDGMISMRVPDGVASGLDPTNAHLDPARFGGGLGNQSQRLVEMLLNRSDHNIFCGHFRVAERLAHRARSISLTEFGEAAGATCRARHTWVKSMERCGFFVDVRAEIMSLLPLAEKVLGADDQLFLLIRTEHAKNLTALGHLNGAAVEFESILLAQERAHGSENPTTLEIKHEFVELLGRMRRFDQAIRLIDGVRKVESEILEPSHVLLRNSSFLRANLLNLKGGNYDEALFTVDNLVPLYIETDGPLHPETLAVRRLRCNILIGLGRFADALEQIQTLLPDEERVLGGEHPQHSLVTRQLRAIALYGLDRDDESLIEISALLPIFDRRFGATHPETLRLRLLRAIVLASLVRIEEAIDEVKSLLKPLEHAIGRDDPDYQRALALRESLLLVSRCSLPVSFDWQLQ